MSPSAEGSQALHFIFESANYSVHRHWRVREKWPQWQEQGLYIFFLPPYSPQLNDIEGEWLQIKRHGMQGRSYEMEYELGVAVIEAIDGRYRHKGYACERYLFN